MSINGTILSGFVSTLLAGPGGTWTGLRMLEHVEEIGLGEVGNLDTRKTKMKILDIFRDLDSCRTKIEVFDCFRTILTFGHF